jgi:hypothetical protein
MAHSITPEQRLRIEPLLRERISLRGICRAVGVSLTWLLPCMAEGLTACPDALHVQLPARPTAVGMSSLEAEADERWSFVQKQARKTNHIERFNTTLRQRVSRLVRETLSFSKKLAHHLGAIKYFICHYNLTRRVALPV